VLLKLWRLLIQHCVASNGGRTRYIASLVRPQRRKVLGVDIVEVLGLAEDGLLVLGEAEFTARDIPESVPYMGETYCGLFKISNKPASLSISLAAVTSDAPARAFLSMASTCPRGNASCSSFFSHWPQLAVPLI